MNTEIIVSIDPNPLTGKPQVMKIAQIAFMDWDIKEAKVKFRVYQLDQNGERLTGPFSSHELWTDLSNARILNDEGKVISEQNFPKQEEESEEDYSTRMAALRASGIGQFDFWIAPLVPILNEALERGKNMLDFGSV